MDLYAISCRDGFADGAALEEAAVRTNNRESPGRQRSDLFGELLVLALLILFPDLVLWLFERMR